MTPSMAWRREGLLRSPHAAPQLGLRRCSGGGRKPGRNAVERKRWRKALARSGEDNFTRGSGEVDGRLAEEGSDEEEILRDVERTAAATRKDIATGSGDEVDVKFT